MSLDEALSEGRPRRRNSIARPRHDNHVLTTQELAEYLGCHPQTISKNLDKLPHFRIGYLPRFLESQIRKWVNGEL